MKLLKCLFGDERVRAILFLLILSNADQSCILITNNDSKGLLALFNTIMCASVGMLYGPMMYYNYIIRLSE